MFHKMLSEICSRGSMVRAVRFTSESLPVLIQTARFCPSGTSAPTLFKSSEARPSLSIRPVGLPLRAEICLLYTVLKWNARRVDSTSILLPNSSLFTQAQFKRLCNSNVNGQWFKCKQISIYFYNPGFWQSASVPYWFRVTFSVWLFACYVTRCLSQVHITSSLWIPKNTSNSTVIWTAKSILFACSIHFPPF